MIRRTPVTWLVVVAWVVVHALALHLAGRLSPEGAPWYAWGLVPDDLLRRLGADVPLLVQAGELRRVLTYAFLHGVALGLAISVWILLGTGRRLEAQVGSARFVIVLILGIAGGGTAHALFGSGPLVGGFYAILGLLGGLLVWAFLSPEEHARAARGSALLFLVIVIALTLAFGGSLVADGGALAGGAVAMLLLAPWRAFVAPGFGTKGAAVFLLTLLGAAFGLQAFDTTTYDTKAIHAFLRSVQEMEVKARAVYRSPQRATPRMKEDLARRLAALRNPAVLQDDPDARDALDAYLDVWLRVARGDVPDPFAFDAALEQAMEAWRVHERRLRGAAG